MLQRSAIALSIGLTLLVGCSDESPSAPVDGAAESAFDFAGGDGGGGGGDSALRERCEPSAELLARVDAARMRADLDQLVGLGERRSHASQTKAADYLRAELAKLAGAGATLREQAYNYAGARYVNLELTIAGSDRAAKTILAGAHYDSASSDAAAAPGADDNASGTAALLEIARALAGCTPRGDVRLLFFSNEEKGTIGSTAYVGSIKSTLPPSRVTGYINVDMIGYGPADEDLDLAGRPRDSALVTQTELAVTTWTSLAVRTIINDHCG